MATVNVEKNSYKVEPLYQWDLNQELQIAGLSLATVPEIHFTNVAMSRAIVRQARMDAAGIITVDIPNSMLQKPYTIQVYVCTYAGSTFETQYKLELPVKARTQPGDYTLEDDQEVYSFNALENQVKNVLAAYAAVDAKHQDAISTLNAATAAYNGARGEVNSAIGAAVDTALANIPTLTEDEVVAFCAEGKSTGHGKFLNETGLVGLWDQVQTEDAKRAKIATGSYEGTGTYGSNNANSLSFDFAPSVLIVVINDGTNQSAGNVMVKGQTRSAGIGFQQGGSTGSLNMSVVWDGNTVRWYAGTAPDQMNVDGKTYCYTAFG